MSPKGRKRMININDSLNTDDLIIGEVLDTPNQIFADFIC